MCSVIIQQAENVRVPEWVTDLASFSQWAEANDFPDEGRIDFLAGEIWIDIEPGKSLVPQPGQGGVLRRPWHAGEE